MTAGHSGMASTLGTWRPTSSTANAVHCSPVLAVGVVIVQRWCTVWAAAPRPRGDVAAFGGSNSELSRKTPQRAVGGAGRASAPLRPRLFNVGAAGRDNAPVATLGATHRRPHARRAAQAARPTRVSAYRRRIAPSVLASRGGGYAEPPFGRRPAAHCIRPIARACARVRSASEISPTSRVAASKEPCAAPSRAGIVTRDA